jgi:asparaginyl-tRNA synthetase
LQGVVNVFYSMACAGVNETKLSEYEAELDFVTFDYLLAHLEHLICRVIDLTLKPPIATKCHQGVQPRIHQVFEALPQNTVLGQQLIGCGQRGIKNEDSNDRVFGDDL